VAQITINVPDIKCVACGQIKTAVPTGIWRDMNVQYDAPDGWHRFRLERDPARSVFLCMKCASGPLVYISREAP
jgi:hypothetical protein